MVVATSPSWLDLKAEMTRVEVTVADVATALRGLGEPRMSYAKFSVLVASTKETTPTPEFAERVLAAIKVAAETKAAQG